MASHLESRTGQRQSQPKILLSKATRTRIRLTTSYIFLSIGTLFMLFPVFWMITTALKPEWQVFNRPPIWLPQYWHKTDAGEGVSLLNLWTAKDPETGEKGAALKLGSRRYSSVIPVDSLPEISALAKDEAGDAVPTEIENTLVNVRDGQGKDVVAVGTDGDDLLVVPFAELQDIIELPLDQINAGERGQRQFGAYELPTRRVKLDNGDTLEILQLGPQTQLSTVIEAEAATHAILVPEERVGKATLLPLDRVEVKQHVLVGDDSETPYVVIDEANWRPTIPPSILRTHAFTVLESELIIEEDLDEYNLGKFRVGTVTDSDGETLEIAIVLQADISAEEGGTVLIIAREYMDAVQMVPSASLFRPFPELIDGTIVRVKDFTLSTVREESINFDKLGQEVAIIGDRQDMALLIPAESIEQAFDVPGKELKRNTSISLKWGNFVDAMTRKLGNATFLTFFKNTIIVTGLSIIGHLMSVTLVAYAFARLRAPGKNMLFGLVLATMMLPSAATIIPVYIIFRDLGAIDTLWPMFIRSFFGNALLIFLLRQFFLTIPIELEEAARIDGANRFQTFSRIMLPLILPALTTVVIFTFLWRWNDLFDAAIFLNSPSNYTVAIGLSQFRGQYEAEFTLLMAAATVVMLPTILLFFFAQRFFIEGISTTGLKG